MQLHNYKCTVFKYDKQISIEMTLKWILVCHQCLSVHSAAHFNHISKTIEDNYDNYKIAYKDALKWVKKVHLSN